MEVAANFSLANLKAKITFRLIRQNMRAHQPVLEDKFVQNQNPSLIERKKLSRLVNLTEKQVYDWFSNRRYKYRQGTKNISKMDEELLEDKFKQNMTNPTLLERKALSCRVNLTEQQIYDWFFNRRYEARKEAKEKMKNPVNPVKVLEDIFVQNQNPNLQLRKAISRQVNLTQQQIKDWFCNRRASTRKEAKKINLENSIEFDGSSSENDVNIGNKNVPLVPTGVRLTTEQTRILEECFQKISYPDKNKIVELSRQLNLTENKIKTWFQNKRCYILRVGKIEKERKIKAATQMSDEISKRLNMPIGIIPTMEHQKMLPNNENYNHLNVKSPCKDGTDITLKSLLKM